MQNKFILSNNQQDCLAELMNIAYGSATAAITMILNSFATLNIPDINIIKTNELKPYLKSKVKANSSQIIATQLINGKLSGENVFLIDEQSAKNMTKIFNQDDEIYDDEMLDVVLEITNILSSATTSKLAELLSTEVSFSAPSVQTLSDIEDFDNAFLEEYNQIIIISTQLKFIDFDIEGKMLILTKDESILWIKEALDKVLEDL